MSTQKPLLLLISLALALSLAACGGDKTSGGGGGADATDGGDSPRDVVNRMAAVAESGDMSDLIPMLLPEHRATMTMMVGIMAPSMAVAFGSMGSEGDDAAKAKAKAMSDEWEAILKKHKIDMPDDKEGGGMGALMGGGGDPKEAVAKFHKLLGHVDHRAFLKESEAFMEKHSDKSKSKSKGGMKKFNPAEVKIVEDGDSATVTLESKPTPMTLVRKNGRWFIDMTSMM